MRKLFFAIIALLLFQNANSQSRFVLHDINVVDVDKGTIRSNQVVIIEGDRIKEILALNKYRKSQKDSIISLKGKYLLPGLWDMHTHVWMADAFFPLFLANGVTGFRDMFGSVQQFQTWRKGIAAGNKSYPDFYYCGPIVDGPKPVWPGSVAISNSDQARRTVDSIKNILKTDFVKVYSLLPRDSYFAIAEECRKNKIDFAGHVPNLVTVSEAANAGQKCQEHLTGMLEIASDSSDLYYKVVRAVDAGTVQSDLGTDTFLLNRSARRKMLVRTFNNEKLKSVAKELAAKNTWICPTLVVNYNIANLDDSLLAADVRMKYISSFMRNFWNPKQDFRFRSATKEYFQVGRMEFEKKMECIPVLHAAGVKLLAGTDTPNPYCFPGFSLHDELEWFVKAGLSPADALRTATINPAIYFLQEKNLGTVDIGKIASLVILDNNPLDDIRNTTSVQMVILRGSIMDRKKLDEMLDKVRAQAAQ
jgi:hypothetical protein